MLHRGAARSFPIARNVPTACVWEGAAGQGALPASVVRALHMTTATEHRLPHVQHTAEAGGIIPPRFMTIMTIYARAAVSLPGIATRLISDDGGFATDLGKTDHAGRPSGQLHTGLALLGETDEGPCHRRISGSSLLTKYDFGESPERWTQSYSGDFALIFVLILATARPIEIATLSAVDLRTFDQDAPAGHGGPNRVCLFAGTTPKENQEKNFSTETLLEIGTIRAGTSRKEGVWRCCLYPLNEPANAHVQAHRPHGNEAMSRHDRVRHTGTGRRAGGLFQSAAWISTLACSSNANGGGTRTRRLLLSLCSPVLFPCWEASLSGWRRFARPASCCVSCFHRFAWARGTPGSGTPSPKVLFNMATGGLTAAPLADDEMPAVKSGKLYSATVASFHLLDLPESARSSKLAPFFQDDVSWPMSGSFFTRGDTDADASQLSLRTTRVATTFPLLIGVGCTGAATMVMERLLQRRRLILTATRSSAHRLDAAGQL